MKRGEGAAMQASTHTIHTQYTHTHTNSQEKDRDGGGDWWQFSVLDRGWGSSTGSHVLPGQHPLHSCSVVSSQQQHDHCMMSIVVSSCMSSYMYTALSLTTPKSREEREERARESPVRRREYSGVLAVVGLCV